MKYWSTLVIIWLLSIASQAQTTTLNLSGEVLNAQPAMVYLQKFDNKIFHTVDSARVKKGKFEFHTALLLPELYGVSIDTNRVPLYIFLDKEKISVQLDSAKGYSTSLVKGSVLQDQFNDFKKEPAINISDYIKAHPASLVTAYILYRNYSYRLTPAQIEENIALLDPSLHNTAYVNTLKELVRTLNGLAVGKKAPDIIGNSPEGTPVKLSAHYQKYTLIDFWASWCAPCRKENPNVVAAFQKYKDKGFNVFGVSLDKSRDSWIKAIENDHLNWLQVSELNYWNSEIAKTFGVRAIPSNFLIDEHGIIVARNLRGEELQKKLDELLNH
ncbi:alkyl hydroperoxide reductase [Niastella vici]|uniref:Alkyl hydroperoxide reductase n=1 Tax=Niastella vici TaxID=1703345 RepID=A0A1V9FG80_9BACT|nr:TlpA disulfide reductase family protein [Niastella vici]OQP57216.1 alkyl hydroperoxide reductase [Niastella vici]